MRDALRYSDGGMGHISCGAVAVYAMLETEDRSSRAMNSRAGEFCGERKLVELIPAEQTTKLL